MIDNLICIASVVGVPIAVGWMVAADCEAEMSHTPGPWKVSRQNGDGLSEFEGLVGVTGPVQTNSLGKKFTMYVAQYIKPEDGNLIAAAPELLAELEAALNFIDDPKQQARAIAVIEKARCET